MFRDFVFVCTVSTGATRLSRRLPRANPIVSTRVKGLPSILAFRTAQLFNLLCFYNPENSARKGMLNHVGSFELVFTCQSSSMLGRLATSVLVAPAWVSVSSSCDDSAPATREETLADPREKGAHEREQQKLLLFRPGALDASRVGRGMEIVGP